MLQVQGYIMFYPDYSDFISGLTHYRPAMPFGNRKISLEDLFSSVLLQFKKNITPLET